MATEVLHPDPQSFPIGTTIAVYERPVTAPRGWNPVGSALSEPTVSNTGTLEVTGLTEGKSYIGRATVEGKLKQITFAPEIVSSTGVTTTKVEELIAEKAVSTTSPAFTGTPTAPTASPGTNTTQLATTAFDHAAVKVEEERALAAEALKAAKASNLSDLASASTARTNLGLGTAATTAASAYDVSGAAATAQAAAEDASEKLQGVHAVVTTAGTLEPDLLTPVNVEGGAAAQKLPTGLGKGRRIAVEKHDATTTEVAIEGNIRGEAAQTFNLKYSKEVIVFETDTSGSWWIVGRYMGLTSIKEATRQIIRRSVAIPAGQVPGNEVLLDEYVKLVSGEKRKILWVDLHTTSGTIKVAIKHGEAGTTEFAGSAYAALEATSTPTLTSTTVELADKDRLTITTSSGSSPKGLWVTLGEEVTAP